MRANGNFSDAKLRKVSFSQHNLRDEPE